MLELDSYQAKFPAPFAVLGIRTAGEKLAGIDYLPRGAATLDPLTRFAERVCRQIDRYLDDPAYATAYRHHLRLAVRQGGGRDLNGPLKRAQLKRRLSIGRDRIQGDRYPVRAHDGPGQWLHAEFLTRNAQTPRNQ